LTVAQLSSVFKTGLRKMELVPLLFRSKAVGFQPARVS